MTIRLMLADDHCMLREGLRRSMSEEGFDVVAEAQDGVQAVRLAEELSPDVILMDVSMPNCDGVEACRQVKALGTDSKVVMLTMHADKEVLANAIRAGASGYLVKDCSTKSCVRWRLPIAVTSASTSAVAFCWCRWRMCFI